MRIITRDLKAGAVMSSGEIVKSVAKSGKGYRGNVKLCVTLEKNGRSRMAYWNYFGTIAIKSNGPEPVNRNETDYELDNQKDNWLL